MITVLIIIIIVLHTFSTTVLIRDLRSHWPALLKEPGSIFIQAPFSFVMYFISAFGISDFAISTAVYHKVGWAELRKLPGTLNAQTTLPVMVFSIAYLITVEVDLSTLLPLLIVFVLGAFLSPMVAVRLPVRRIRQILAFGLLLAASTILATKLGLLQMGGQAISLHGFKMAIAIVCFFLIGALKAMGVSSYPLTMITTFFLGLHPLISYPIMMGGGALAAPLVLVRYIKLDSYMRKVTLLAATAGVAGGAIAAFIVKSMNTSLLQWLVVAVAFYAAIDILLDLRREKH